MLRIERLFVLAVLLEASMCAQSSPAKSLSDPLRLLTLVGKQDLNSEVSGMLALPERCDGAGNLYLRVGNGQEAAIRKISPEGKGIATIPNAAIPDAPHPHMGRFNVDANGTVYMLGSVHVDRYLFTFGSDGSFKSKIKLDPGFEWLPANVAPFGSGDFLVSGVRIALDGSDQTRRPFTGIFSSSGSLRKEVLLPDDQKLHQMAESGDTKLVGVGSPVNNRAFSFGSAESSPDGNVYLMRSTQAPIVYAISPGGEVVKRFVVDAVDQSTVLEPLHILDSRLAVLFHNEQDGTDLIRVTDTDGKFLATYQAARGADSPGPGLACWAAPDRFEFIGEEHGHLTLKSYESR